MTKNVIEQTMSENRGGKRKGAGRKPLPFKIEKVTVKTPKSRKKDLLDFNKKLITEEKTKNANNAI